MKIIFFTADLRTGGAERQILSLIEAWPDRESVPEILLCHGRGTWLARAQRLTRCRFLSQDTTPSGPPDVSPRYYSSLGLIFRLRRFLRDERPDVVVCFLWWIAALASLARWGLKHRPVLAWSCQSDVAADFARHRDGGLRRWVFKIALKNAVDHFIFVNPDLRDRTLRMLGVFDPARASVTPNCVNVGEDRSAGPLGRASENPIHGPAPPVSILAVGRLHWIKGVDLLLGALALLKERGLVFRARIVGDGVEQAALRELAAKLDLDRQVAFTGGVQDAIPEMERADIFVSPSRAETFGIATAEAMALGLAVAATPTDGSRQLIAGGSNGLLAAACTPEALADSLAELLTSAGLRRKLGSAAQESIQKFVPSVIAREYFSILAGTVTRISAASVAQERPVSDDGQRARRPGRRLKVLRVITRLNIGGPSLQASLLTRHLGNRNYDVWLATGTCEEGEREMTSLPEGTDRVIRIESLSRSVSLLDNARAWWRLYRIMRSLKPDIVHTHTAMAGCLGRSAAFAARVPVIVHTFHGNSLRGYFSPFIAAVFLRVERLLARVTDAICIISAQQLRELSEEMMIAPRGRFRVVPLGLDLEPFLAIPGMADTDGMDTETAGPTSRAKPLRVAWLGRLAPIKNIGLLVRVAESVFATGADVEFQVAGDGPERHLLEGSVARFGPRFDWTGWETDVPSWIGRADLLIQTSHNEGTPVALIQGMASGRPFVSTPAGGVVDMVASPPLRSASGVTWYSNAVLAEPEAETFAAAIVELAGSRERLFAMGQAARAFAAERYPQEALIATLDTMYRELTEHRGVRARAGIRTTRGGTSPAAPSALTASRSDAELRGSMIRRPGL